MTLGREEGLVLGSLSFPFFPCRRQTGARVTGMVIVDITMLSGFEPDASDLDKVTIPKREGKRLSFFKNSQWGVCVCV